MTDRLETTRRAGGLAVVLALLLTVLQTPAGAVVSERIAGGEDPVSASIALSQRAFPTPSDAEPGTVVIGRADLFPDNLAAGGLLSDGVMLLHPSAADSPRADVSVVAEIERLGLTDCSSDAPRVFIMGGTAALTDALDEALGDCAVRVAGPTRNATSVAAAETVIARRASADLEPAATVYIAVDDNPADSAAITPVVAARGLPLVVTPTSRLADEVATFIDAHPELTDLAVLGGEAAIDREVAAALDALRPGSVRRIAGASRDATAVEIAGEWGGDTPTPVGLVDGFAADFWTVALPAGAVLGAGEAPMLFANGAAGVLGATAGYLGGRGCTSGLVVFGDGDRVGDDVVTDALDLLAPCPFPEVEAPPRDYVYVDRDGVLRDSADRALAGDPDSNETVLSVDVNPVTGEIAYTTNLGDLWCICAGSTRQLQGGEGSVVEPGGTTFSWVGPQFLPELGLLLAFQSTFGQASGTLTAFDPATGEQVGETASDSYDPPSGSDAIATDSLVTTSDGQLVVLSVPELEEVERFSEIDGEVVSASFLGDDGSIAVAVGETVRIISPDRSEEVEVFRDAVDTTADPVLELLTTVSGAIVIGQATTLTVLTPNTSTEALSDYSTVGTFTLSPMMESTTRLDVAGDVLFADTVELGAALLCIPSLPQIDAACGLSIDLSGSNVPGSSTSVQSGGLADGLDGAFSIGPPDEDPEDVGGG